MFLHVFFPPSHLAAVALKIKPSQTLIDWRLSGRQGGRQREGEERKERKQREMERGGEVALPSFSGFVHALLDNR